MKAGDAITATPSSDTAFMRKSIGISSLVKFAIEHGVPERKAH
jgi:hypothetical protein